MEFTSQLRSKKPDFEKVVNNLINEYLRLRVEAENRLGDLFNESDYPSVDKLENCFKFSVRFSPLPDARDFRVDISENELDEFKRDLMDAEKNVKKDLYNRLYSVVQKASNKLKQPDAQFHESLIENMIEICNVLPNLYIDDDANLEKMRNEVDEIASNISANLCRKDANVRNETAQTLSEIQDKMSVFMGSI